MNKINQYKDRFFSLLESEMGDVRPIIDEQVNSLNEENLKDASYTVQYKTVNFEDSQDKWQNELRFFKNTKFTPIFKNDTFTNKLVANSSFQFINSAFGDPAQTWDGVSTSGEFAFLADRSSEKYMTKRGKIYYDCKTNKFSVPSDSPREYFAEDGQSLAVAKGLQILCQQGKKYKSYYGSTGGKSYTQSNDYIVKTDNGKELKIPKLTGYSFKDGKNGASFRIPEGWGWFGCQSKTFLVNDVKYKDNKGYLANNIAKALCPVTETPNNQNSNNQNSNNQNSNNQNSNNQAPRISPSLESVGSGRGFIRQGMSGESVKQVQELLKAKGAYNYDITTYFGSKTRSAVVAYQKANGLKPDGIVGVNTLKSLQGASKGPSTEVGKESTTNLGDQNIQTPNTQQTEFNPNEM